MCEEVEKAVNFCFYMIQAVQKLLPHYSLVKITFSSSNMVCKSNGKQFAVCIFCLLLNRNRYNHQVFTLEDWMVHTCTCM